ncbi:MAG: hypothetical protein E7081_04380 [Bacteroidales bacterium]|nr:hypothetical protein [Bacteroidales bacterium]
MKQRVKHIILFILAMWITILPFVAVATVAPTHRFYLRDYLGSTAAVIDENGDVLQSTVYFPSGLPLTPNNLAPQTIKLHTGKDYFGLQDAGWYDNRARYYDPILARFTTQDPLAEKYPWLSPYNHCANNPLRFVDRDGKQIFLTPNPLLGASNPLLISNNHPITTVNRISPSTPKIPNPTELHHIIPKSLKGHKIVEQAIKDGFKLNGKENNIGIEKFYRQTNTGRHGNHPKYTEGVRQLLEKNATKNSPLNAVKKTIKELKQEIENNPDTKINDLFNKNLNITPVDNTFIKSPNDIIIINTN